MMDCRPVGADALEFEIDTTLFSRAVIAKTLYWFAAEYVIYRQALAGGRERIRLTRKDGASIHFHAAQAKLSDTLADFQTREIILRESSAIRNILYIKAFADAETGGDAGEL